MRRVVVAALLAIAVLFGGSVALITLVTDADAPVGAGAIATPPAGAPSAEPGPPPVAPAASSPAFVLPPAPPARVVTPEPEAAPPPPLVREDAPPELDLGPGLASIEQRIAQRCGHMQIAAPRRLPPADAGEAVLLLEVRAEGGRLAIVNSWPTRPGRVRPALVACAQWAVRELSLPARGQRKDGTYRVPIVVSVELPPEPEGDPSETIDG